MEYDRNTINFALKSDNPLDIVPSSDQIGHGTMLAGIIAGNVNIDQEFSGVVPEAEFVIVKLKLAKNKNRKIFAISDDVICYQESDIIAGINYVSTVANRLERPISICLASGTSQGEHYGVGATSNYVSFVSQIPRRAITIAAGNEGNRHRHYLGEINTEIASYNEFELKISVKDKSFSMEIWQHSPYRLSMDIISPTGESFTGIYPKLNKCLKHDFIFEPSVVWINNIISETETGEQLILIRFENAKEGIWNFKVHNLDNKASIFNVWLPSGEIISDETYFLESNPNTTIMSPGNAIFPLTVTAYNQISGSILNNSSRGFTTSNVVKPDIAAPGYELICPLLNNTYGTASGTGAAAAHVTGIVAMILEWGIVNGNYTIIAGAEINKLLIRGAERDSDIEYPNEIWGYGKIDIWGFFTKLIIT
jgi:subtilisin family serine protease